MPAPSALGSTINLTAADGAVAEGYLYDAWGNYRELDVADPANPGNPLFDATPDLDSAGLYAWESYLANIQSAFDPSLDPPASSPASWNRFTYTGHEFDPATGLYYFKARFYDPELGRFASEDPYLGDPTTPPSLGRYLYAYANPLLFVDLSGYSAYRVREGDSLSDIARKQNVRLGDLVTANQTAGVIRDPNQIAAGQEIWVPDVRQAGDVSIYSRDDAHATTVVYERIDDEGNYHFRRYQQSRSPAVGLTYDSETRRWSSAASGGPANWSMSANDWGDLPDPGDWDLPPGGFGRGRSPAGGSSIMAGFDWDVFRQGVARRSLDLGLNVGTMGGWAEIQAGIENGTVTDRASAARAAATGVFKTITLGGGEAAVDAYAEGQNFWGVSGAAAGGVGRTVLPIEEAGIMLDPNRSGWEKAQAGGSGAIKVAGVFLGISVIKKSASAGEISKYLGQGFTPEQSQYLAQQYSGLGHHFFRREWNLPKWLTESPFSDRKPKGISRGDFYELHFKSDPTFYGTKFPKSIGGTWSGSRIGLKKPGPVGRVWYGSPTPLKVTTGAGLLGAGGVMGWYFEKSE